jgi:hypothetical protein
MAFSPGDAGCAVAVDGAGVEEHPADTQARSTLTIQRRRIQSVNMQEYFPKRETSLKMACQFSHFERLNRSSHPRKFSCWPQKPGTTGIYPDHYLYN